MVLLVDFFRLISLVATNKFWSGKNRIVKGTLFTMSFEASTFVVAIHGALDEHTHFWIKKIHFHKSSVYVAYEGLWTQVVLFLEAFTRYTIWRTFFKHVKPEAPRRYKYTTFVKTVFFKLKMGLPIQRLLNHNYQGPYPPGNLKFGLLHNEDSSKSASLAISNVRFDVMLGSPSTAALKIQFRIWFFVCCFSFKLCLHFDHFWFQSVRGPFGEHLREFSRLVESSWL